ALVFASVFATAAVAADDMSQCELNLQKLRDLRASISVVGQPLLSEVQSLRMNAQDARDDKDAKKCISYTLQALQKLRTAGKG
ncbi:hypothetical protein, partial [Pseudomonas putida]|uniref:hypothetical protein n=1 Tax=Pseudomonas putida TaxID=303 RepID=UPI00390698C6